MMKLFFCLIFSFCTLVFTFGQDFNYYRSMINEAEKSPAVSKKFAEKVSADYNKTKQPIFLALTGVAHFFQAKHSYNPVSKMTHFNKGKKMLDRAVAEDESNVEIRFMRYLSQKKIPMILGYHYHLASDEKLLRGKASGLQDEVLKKEIIRSLNLK